MITHKQFIDKWEWKRYRESVALWYQCVSLIKKYSEEVWGIKWLSFWGSAINGWEKKWNLDNYFDRRDMPRQWDIVFFNKTPNNPYWHVAIHNDDYSILEQNGWVWGGTGLWVDAIRIHKAPANYLWCMRPKPIEVTPLMQNTQQDCSLLSVINCYRLNQWNDARSFTQEVVNELMKEYINKNPRDAFQFFKNKKYKIKLLPLNFEQAQVRIKRWSAVCIFMKGGSQNHWSCYNGKLFDSVLGIKDFDLVKAYNEWKIGTEFFQIR